jgi:CBS domain-containing protein
MSERKAASMANETARLNASVETVTTRPVVQMLEDILMSEARAIAVQYDDNGFPIVTREGRLIEVITKGDLLRALRESFSPPDVWSQPVARWMAHGVLALRLRDPLGTAAESMLDSGLWSLPVIDDRGVVVGMVSSNDLMTALGGEAPV